MLGHELVHAFQYDISGLGRAGGGLDAGARSASAGRRSGSSRGWRSTSRVGPVDPHTAMWLRDAALTGKLPTIEQLTTDPRFFPYRWGQALWAYVGGRWGDAAIGQILKLTGQGVPYEEAFQRVLNISLDDLSEDWHAAIRRAYLPLLAERPEAREVAQAADHPGAGGRPPQRRPRRSRPTASYVAFLSELDFMDIELYLADAQTGEVDPPAAEGHGASTRTSAACATSTPPGPSRPTASASPSARCATGHDVLVFLDVRSGRASSARYRSPGVSEITTPTWSPDGRTIVFSGHHRRDLGPLPATTWRAERTRQAHRRPLRRAAPRLLARRRAPSPS